MIINPYSREVENITFSIQAQTQRSIAFTSANPKEGVSTITHSVSQRLLLSGYSVLLVDLNSTAPAVERILSRGGSGASPPQFNTPELVTPRGEQSVFTGVTLGSDKANIAQLRKPHVLNEMISQWKESFDYVVVDCAPVLSPDETTLSAEHVALACDAMVLVTLAQRTTESCLVQAIRKLNQERVNLLGIVINDHFNPDLKGEFQRQIKKLKRLLPSLFTLPLSRLSELIEHNTFFSIDN